jgi:hypothetical protein
MLRSLVRVLPLVRAVPLAAVFLLGGCASTMTTQVTSFHQLAPGSLHGQRFVITPSAEQQGSLEFGTYAGYVREALAAKGLIDAGSAVGGAAGTAAGTGATTGDAAGRADLGVSLSYSITGRTAGYREGTTGYAGFGAGSGGFSMGGVGIGIGFPIGVGTGSNEAVLYQRSLTVQIDRLGRSEPGRPESGRVDPSTPAAAPGPTGTRLFEARAVSEGPAASLAPVMRPMVQAIFEDFPGASGTTRVVRSEVSEAP